MTTVKKKHESYFKIIGKRFFLFYQNSHRKKNEINSESHILREYLFFR